MDLSCGFHISLSSGKRSRNVRVMGICSSNSANSCCATDISDSPLVCWLVFCCSNSSFPGPKRLSSLLQTSVGVAPTLRDLPVILSDQPERFVMELDERSTVHFAQAVLQIVGDRVRHDERPADLQQCWPLDGLNVSPEMSVVVAKVAVPSASGPGLNLHRQRSAFANFVGGTKLLEQRGKSHIERRSHMDFLGNVQC